MSKKIFELAGVIAVDGMTMAIKGLKELDGHFKAAEKSFFKFGRQLSTAGAKFSTNLTLPLAAAGAAVAKFGSDFEKSMTMSTAIMGNLSDEMRKQLSDTAREVAKSTTFTAAEAAKAYYFLSSAGYSAADAIGALPRVTKFALAGQMGLETATSLLADAQNALGLKVADTAQNMGNLSRVSDVLSEANNMANGSVQDFALALSNKGAAALKMVNKTVEEGVATLAAYASVGVKGADAGEKLSIVLRDLQTQAIKSPQAFKDAGVSVFDTSGKMRNMADIIGDLEGRLSGMSHAEKRATFMTLGFQDRSVAATMQLIGMSGAIRDYEKKLKSAAGTTEDVANKQMQNFQDQLTLVWHKVQDVAIGLYSSLQPVLMDTVLPALESITGKIAGVANWFNDLNSTTKKVIFGLLAFTAAAGPMILITGKMIGAIAGVSAAIKTMRLAMVGFTAFMGTNPLGMALIGIGLLTAAIIGVASALDKIKRKKAELAADKTYSASAEEERKDNLENIRLWQERLAWLKAQHNPTQTMIDEMADLKQAIADTNEALGNTPESAGVGLFDPEAEARKQKALDAEKKRQEEIERVHKESLDRIARATLDANELNMREEEAAVRYATNVLKMKEHEIHAIRTGFRLEREKNDADAAKKREDYLARENEAALNREKEWTAKLVEQSGNRIAILENERAEAIAAANGKESEIAKIEAYYREEKKKAEKEMAREAQESFAERVRGFIDMIGNIGAGIAGIFQQSTANRQVALDNQQQAERSAIENSTRSEKEKRKALADLDKKQDAQQRAFRRKAAAESKKINIFESIMGTANAVVGALASVMPPLNFIYAGVVGAIGAAKTALIAAQPLPLAAGGLVQSGRGGVLGHIGEGRESEIVLPVDTGVKLLARRLLSTMRDFVPAPLAVAGAGGYGGGGGSVAYNIGTFIGDDRGIKEFERRQLSIRNHEAQRKGQMA